MSESAFVLVDAILLISNHTISEYLRAISSVFPLKIANLVIQVCRLYSALAQERLRSANLEAAIRAALGAASDGEADPLGYLRDELPDESGSAYGA